LPKNLSDRSKDKTVYYNILNILGDRMQKIQMQLFLLGSSEQGPADGLAMSKLKHI
jgi:hypothetical protein